MSVYIHDAPLGVCDRCHVKMLRKRLSPDRDTPGLIVCEGCNDVKDPWKKPFTPKDANITTPQPRPEQALGGDGKVSVVNADGSVTTGPIPTDLTVRPRSD